MQGGAKEKEGGRLGKMKGWVREKEEEKRKCRSGVLKAGGRGSDGFF